MNPFATNIPPDKASTEHADAEEDMTLEFSSGVDRMNPPHKIQEGYVREMTNMYYPRETAIPRTRPGIAVKASAHAGTRITAVHVYRKSETVVFTCYTSIHDTTQGLYYLDANEASVALSADLGSLETPCMVTFNGCLLVAVPGIGIYEWQGGTSTDPTPAHGWSTFTFTDAPTAGDTCTVGTQVWTWQVAARSGPFQAVIGTGGTAALKATASCANLTAAINQDSSLVIAVVTGDTKIMSVAARRVGTAGNFAVGEVSGVIATAGAMTQGVNGLHLDLMDTYSHPHPAVMVIDQNQRLVAAGDPASPDTVFFSAPAVGGGAEHWQWATGDYGGGETFLAGYLDGMDISCIHPMGSEMVVHKSGQGREIYRINTSDPDPSTWTQAVKKFHANTSALNGRCAVNVTDKQLFLDTRGFSSLTGDDTYDEIGVSAAGVLISDQLSSPDIDAAFIVTNPDENYCMVFRDHGRVCWVFHYGSGRWAKWQLATNDDIVCGCYSDTLKTVLLGTADSKILKLDATVATDEGNAFASEIVTRGLGDGLLKKILIKQVLLDWHNNIAGNGDVWLVINNEDNPSQEIFSFTVDALARLLHDATEHLADATSMLLATSYGRVNSFVQGGGELVALRIRLLQGAFDLHGVTLRVAYHGRVAQ
jgi:hypothetical protein